MNVSELEKNLSSALPGADIHVENLRNDSQDHILVRVAAQQFTGVSRLDQHRIIYRALTGIFDFEKNMLSIRTETK